MKKSIILSALLSLGLITGCSQTTVNENPKDTKTPEEQTKTDKDQTKDTENDTEKDSDKDSSKDQNSSSEDETRTAQNGNQSEPASSEPSGSGSGQTSAPAESQSPAVPEPDALDVEVSGKLIQALNDQGFSTSEISWQATDTGNVEGIVDGTGMGGNMSIYLTSFAADTSPEKTFEANTEADETNNMTIMNEWQDNGNIVRVVRNNMANLNFVEVLDSYQRLTYHFVDETPEQLQPVLNALQSLGYPVE